MIIYQRISPFITCKPVDYRGITVLYYYSIIPHFEALDLFDELANDPELHFGMQLEPGDMQFVYNHSQLHDRTSFVDWPDPAHRRHLFRLWLSIEGDRELPPSFEERYGSIEVGNRGGIITEKTKLHAPLDPA